MNIDSLTYGEIKEICSLFSSDKKRPVNNLSIGSNYLFRTVTMIYTGELVEEQDDRFVISKAAWIAETERWADSVKSAEFKEVEPYPDDRLVHVFKSGMLDICEITSLPRDQK